MSRQMVRLAALAVGLALLAGLFSSAAALTEEEKERFVKNVLLPSPSELFVAMEKMGMRSWSDMASFNPNYDYDANIDRALNLGIRAADGFLAIQSRDKKKLGEMITVIMTLAEELLIREAVLNRGPVIEDLARRGQWVELRQELEALRGEIVVEMERMGDKDIATLISAGGWLEGLRAVAKGLMDYYDQKASTILYQPRLVAYFESAMSDMKPGALKHPQVSRLREALPEIGRLLDVGYRNPVPRENVLKLYQISSALIRRMEKG